MDDHGEWPPTGPFLFPSIYCDDSHEGPLSHALSPYSFLLPSLMTLTVRGERHLLPHPMSNARSALVEVWLRNYTQ